MERRYCTVEKEALACILAIEHWDKYLLCKPFTLLADQHAVQQLLGSSMQAENICKLSKFICWVEQLPASLHSQVLYIVDSIGEKKV